MDKENIIKVLSDARDLLTDQNKWCRGSLAVDKDNRQITPDSIEACQWCMLGAIEKVSGNRVMKLIAGFVVGQCINQPIHKFNDSECTKHEDVLNVFNSTIDMVKENKIDISHLIRTS